MPGVPTGTLDCRFSHRRARYFLLRKRKYPKSAHRGRTPYVPPAQLGRVFLFPACVTRGYAGSPDGLRPPASVRFGACGPGCPPGRARHFGVCAVRGVGQRLEHPHQAPVGGEQGDRSTGQKARGRLGWQGVSAGARRKEDTAPILRPRKTGVLRGANPGGRPLSDGFVPLCASLPTFCACRK